MKQQIIFCFTLLLAIYNFCNAQFEPLTYQLNNSNLGKEFFVVFPQNEVTAANMRSLEFAIYILSYQNGEVNFEDLSTGTSLNFAITAFNPFIFSSNDHSFLNNYEIEESEVVSKNVIRISSNVDIAVWVISVKEFSAEGYMALPTSAWGNKVINCSYTDVNEGNLNRANGFVVIASKDNTNITIDLKGKGEGNLKYTAKGKKIGETITAKLNRGEAFLVRGTGRTKDFDMTGTIITADKPIGLVSFHIRAMIPINSDEGRQYLIEMIPAVQSWGKRFATIEFKRQNKGDYFRLVASQDNTNWSVKYYDINTKKLINQMSGTLQKAGDFFDYNGENIQPGVQKESIRGLSYWEADKPVLLMQYAYSRPWDDDKNWKPVMVVIPPVEQYLPSTILQTAVQSGFNLNEVAIFAIGDPNDKDHKLLKSIKIGNYELDDIEQNNIPGTNVYWYREFVLGGKGNRKITSNTKLAGYINGFSQQNVYCWMMTTGLNKIDEFDELPPLIEWLNNENPYLVKVTENRNGQPKFEQRDQGISKIILDQRSKNIEMTYIDFDPREGIYQLEVQFNVIDLEKPAVAYFYALDRAGNIAFDSLFYDGSTTDGLNIEDWDAGDVKIGETICSDVQGGIKIENIGTQEITLLRFEDLLAPFSITEPTVPQLPYNLAAGKSVYFKSACFSPTEAKDYEIIVNLVAKVGNQEKSYPTVWKGKGIPQVSVQESTSYNKFRIYPNPAGKYIIIEHNGYVTDDFEYQIYDLTGRMIQINENLQKKGNLTTINIENIQNGLYIIKLRIKATITTFLFVKI